jgi:hypothetical protein
MSLQDFRGQGPPGDIGTFQLPCNILVFKYVFSGTTYTCAARAGVRGWILVSYGVVVATVVQGAVDALTPGRTWDETVGLVGVFTFASGLLLDNYTTLRGPAKLVKATGTSFTLITNRDHTVNGNKFVTLNDLDIMGDYGQAGSANGDAVVIVNPTYYITSNLESLTNFYMHDVKIHNFNGAALSLTYVITTMSNVEIDNINSASPAFAATNMIDSKIENVVINNVVQGESLHWIFCGSSVCNNFWVSGPNSNTWRTFVLEGVTKTTFDNIWIYNSFVDAMWLQASTIDNSFNGLHIFRASQKTTATYHYVKMSGGTHNRFSNVSFGPHGSATIPAYGFYEDGSSGYNQYVNVDVETSAVATGWANLNGTTSQYQNIMLAGAKVDQNNILSAAFAIDAIAVITVTTAHGLAITPTIEDVSLTLIENTAVDDWVCGFVKVVSVGAINIVAKVNVTVASLTAGATAKLGVRVGKA